MTAHELRILTEYTQAMACSHGLKDWNLRVTVDHTGDSENLAETFLEMSQTAEIKFQSDFRKANTCLHQRLIVMHELLHCHLSRVHQCADDAEVHLGTVAGPVWISEFDRQLEYAIDAIAIVWAREAPTIEWS